jgi:dTMP kinase
MNTSLGRFIVVDGGEGAGKGIHLSRLAEILPPESTIFTREPGGTERAEMIRQVILSGPGANALTNFHLFCAARADHVEYKIGPARKAGKTVVCDRFDMSTFAYQIYGQENHFLLDSFERERELLGEVAQPSVYIYLDVDVEEGLRRAEARQDGNHLDLAGIEFHKRVRDGYLEFLRRHDNSVVVDANRSIEEVWTDFRIAVETAMAQ